MDKHTPKTLSDVELRKLLLVGPVRNQQGRFAKKEKKQHDLELWKETKKPIAGDPKKHAAEKKPEDTNFSSSKGITPPYCETDLDGYVWTWFPETRKNNQRYGEKPPAFNKKTMAYMGFAPQKCPKTGRDHLQGYTQFKKKQASLPRVKTQHKCESMHVERQKGTADECRDYYVKDEKKTNTGPPEEFGEFQKICLPRQVGQEWKGYLRDKADKKAWEHDKELMDLKDIAWPIELFDQLIEKPSAKNKKRHFYIWGPPTLFEKTRTWQELFEGQKVFIPSNSRKLRFEGYDGEEVIIYDDMGHVEEEEIAQVTETWLHFKRVPGEPRYNPIFWPRRQTRLVLIFENKPPPGEDHVKFHARFGCIDLNPHKLEDWEVGLMDESTDTKPSVTTRDLRDILKLRTACNDNKHSANDDLQDYEINKMD